MRGGEGSLRGRRDSASGAVKFLAVALIGLPIFTVLVRMNGCGGKSGNPNKAGKSGREGDDGSTGSGGEDAGEDEGGSKGRGSEVITGDLGAYINVLADTFGSGDETEVGAVLVVELEDKLDELYDAAVEGDEGEVGDVGEVALLPLVAGSLLDCG